MADVKKRKVRIVENSWLAKLSARKLGYDYVAMVLGHTIYLYHTTLTQFFARPSWVMHELKHVEQYEQLGLLGFLWKYAVEYRRHGYWQNALEVAARAAEGETTLLEKYDLSAYEKYLPKAEI